MQGKIYSNYRVTDCHFVHRTDLLDLMILANLLSGKCLTLAIAVDVCICELIDFAIDNPIIAGRFHSLVYDRHFHGVCISKERKPQKIHTEIL